MDWHYGWIVAWACAAPVHAVETPRHWDDRYLEGYVAARLDQ